MKKIKLTPVRTGRQMLEDAGFRFGKTLTGVPSAFCPWNHAEICFYDKAVNIKVAGRGVIISNDEVIAIARMIEGGEIDGLD